MSLIRLGFASGIFTTGECYKLAFAPLTKFTAAMLARDSKNIIKDTQAKPPSRWMHYCRARRHPDSVKYHYLVFAGSFVTFRI